MQGQPEDKATPKSKKILPITAVSLCLFLFTRLIPCCLPSTAPDGQERDPGQTGGETTPSCGSVRNYSIRGLSCNKNKRSPSWHLGQRDNLTPSQAPKWGCLHLQGQRPSVSHQRAFQKGTRCCPAHPVPSPLSSVRDHSQQMQRDWTIHTQRLEVKAPEQYVSRVTFSAGKTQHISMQTTVCLVFQLLKQRHLWSELGLVLLPLKILFSFNFPWISEIYPQCLLFQLFFIYSTLCLKAWNMNMIWGDIFVYLSPTASLRLEN